MIKFTHDELLLKRIDLKMQIKTLEKFQGKERAIKNLKLQLRAVELLLEME